MLGSCHEISSRHRQGTNTKYFPPPPRFLYVMSAQFTPPFNIPRFLHITKVPDLKNRRNLHFQWMNPKLRRVGANERPPPHWRARGHLSLCPSDLFMQIMRMLPFLVPVAIVVGQFCVRQMACLSISRWTLHRLRLQRVSCVYHKVLLTRIADRKDKWQITSRTCHFL